MINCNARCASRLSAPGWQGSFQEILQARSSRAGTGNAGSDRQRDRPPRGRDSARCGRGHQPRERVRCSPSAGAGRRQACLAAPPGSVPDRCACAPTPDAPPLLRNYSLSVLPAPIVTGQRQTGSERAASSYLHTSGPAGDRLEVGAPRGSFILRPGHGPVVLISAGVGATPVLAMLHALAAEPPSRDIWWLHSSRRRADEPFAAESRALLAQLPERAPAHLLQRPRPGRRPGP